MKKHERIRQRAAAVTLTAAMTVCLAACGGGQTSESSQGTTAGMAAAAAGESVSETTANVSAAEVETSTLNLLTDTYRANSASVRHDAVAAWVSSDPGQLVPIDIQKTGKEVMDEIFERLYVIDGFGGELLPQLAESEPQKVDGGYQIKLREGIYDSAANPIKASDVVFSYQYLLENSQPENMGQLLNVSQDIKAVDEYTVFFPTGELTGVSDMANLFAQQYIWSEKSWNENGQADGYSTNPIGSGPYIVSNYVTGSSLELVPNPDHWSEGKDFQLARYCANVDKITYYIVTDSTQAANALITGELDYSSIVSVLDQADFKEGGLYAADFNTYSYLASLTRFVLPNCSSDNAFADVNLRKAVMYALDGAQCAIAAGDTTADVAYDLFNAKFPEYRDSWYTDDTFYTNPSKEKAKEYLEASSYDGRELVILCQSGTVWTNIGTYVLTQLQDIGISCRLNAVDNSLFTDTYNDPSNWDLLLAMMAGDNYGIVELDRMMCKDSYIAPRETMNFIVDEELQNLIAICKTAEGHNEENTQELHDYIIDNAYGRGLYAGTTCLIARKDIQELACNFKYYVMPGGCVYSDNQF